MSSASTRTVRTMCPMNCHPTLCGMLADVRDGKLVAVRGDDANPDSRGFLCIRGQAAREVIDNPRRLLHPLLRDKRTDPFRRVTWDDALARIAASIAQAPNDATAFWPGHGTFTNNYGTRLNAALMMRFANLRAAQFFNPTAICWGLGAFGLALTGPLEANTKEDMGEHAQLIVLWGANFASQPMTAPHLTAAKKRGARIVAIDVRETEATAKADDVFIVRPGSDASLALALMHVICAEALHDAAFVGANTVGFDALCKHVEPFTPAWAAARSGVAADRIAALARRYATTRPAMIVLGGSSMHKSANAWHASRAIACLPALTGNLGLPGSGFGPRHGSGSHGRGLADISAADRRPPGSAMPNQMSSFLAALDQGRIQNLLLLGSNMLSSFPDANALARGLANTPLVVSYDLFETETSRRFADVVLPSTAWLEELGGKATNTHLYLMEQALDAPGETRNVYELLSALAARLGMSEFDRWGSVQGVLDALLDHPSTRRATVAQLRAEGGIRALAISQVAHPDLKFGTPSGKVEFVSARAAKLGLSSLPMPEDDAPGTLPLTLTHGRTLGHFHSFYDSGQALPTLAKRESEPELWLSVQDAQQRGIADRGAVRVHNSRGEMRARARVSEKIPPGVLWMRDGWAGLNTLTSSAPVLPDAAVDVFGFSAGQSSFEARAEIEAI